MSHGQQVAMSRFKMESVGSKETCFRGQWSGHPDCPRSIPGREGFYRNSESHVTSLMMFLLGEKKKKEDILFSLVSYLDGDFKFLKWWREKFMFLVCPDAGFRDTSERMLAMTLSHCSSY